MLRVCQLANAESAKKYYAVSDYYVETPGEWLGKGAESLGLSGLVRQQDFEQLCDNLAPKAGRK